MSEYVPLLSWGHDKHGRLSVVHGGKEYLIEPPISDDLKLKYELLIIKECFTPWVKSFDVVATMDKRARRIDLVQWAEGHILSDLDKIEKALSDE